jgi:hypothetical protein
MHRILTHVLFSLFFHFMHFVERTILLLFMLSMSMGWDYVSELWPPMGLLLIPQIIYEYGEPWWNDIDRKKWITCRNTCPSATLSPCLEGVRPVTNCLSHCTAKNYFRKVYICFYSDVKSVGRMLNLDKMINILDIIHHLSSLKHDVSETHIEALISNK